MKLKKKYYIDNKRQIWRIIPTNSGKLVIEEREPEKKQVFFHCLSLDSGEKILNNFQIDNTFWVGIEAVQNDIIFFHKFAKPDMPKHRGIFAFDIKTKEFIWENPDLTFLFLLDEKLFAFSERFEGRKYYSLNPVGGEIVEEFGEDYQLINSLRNESAIQESENYYLFPEVFEAGTQTDSRISDIMSSLKSEYLISGKIEYLINEDMLLVSFHIVNSKGSFDNLFKAADLSTGKYILEEVICKETSLYLTDSFFVKDDLLLLLFGKIRLTVYKIIF